MSSFSLCFAYCDQVDSHALRRVLAQYLDVSTKIRGALKSSGEIFLQGCENYVYITRINYAERMDKGQLIFTEGDRVRIAEMMQEIEPVYDWDIAGGPAAAVFAHYQSELQSLGAALNIAPSELMHIIVSQDGPLETRKGTEGTEKWFNFHITFPPSSAKAVHRILEAEEPEFKLAFHDGVYQDGSMDKMIKLGLPLTTSARLVTLSEEHKTVEVTESRGGSWWRSELDPRQVVQISLPCREEDMATPGKLASSLRNHLNLKNAKTHLESERSLLKVLLG